MTTSATALILGATGQTGQQLFSTLLSSSFYTRIGEYGRRVTADDKVPAASKEKLEQHTIDFEKLDASGLDAKPWDVVFITLGTTKKNAGSAEKFVKIDREYVIDAAKEAKVSQGSENNQRLVYLSSTGANSKSSFLYPQSKGLTEEGLAKLGYKETIVFRPGYLAGTSRGESRVAESIFGTFTGFISHFSNSVEINIGTLGKAIAIAGKLGSDNLPASVGATKVNLDDGTTYTVIGNAGAIELAKLDL
ncbi:hypothetical protein FA13DRAFT_1819195 [Coprinellus micaceus]|uniref:Semialdehyde dehydrogenase NAD-binding domain-containing protein n=1 Tax=Coprinellus micaceus TaxID=71717 RepID=A0A4Y7SJD3_COPMI|nr:hypothetical protein FA13DRAFT_1819195 [Coprinellus micaceus]